MGGTASGVSSLVPFLLGVGPPPPLPVLRANHLAPYAYAVLPPDHPLRSSLEIDYLQARMRHECIRRELAPLLAAWDAGGIRALLFKGFYLSEFVYPMPGARFHGDVDVLIPPEAADEARRIAVELGWVVEVHPDEQGMVNDHCVFTLVRPGGAAFVDVHRRILHSGRSWSSVADRVTASVWENARPREWQGTTVWAPSLVDSLLVGLVLQRAWGDRWGIKTHDPIDFRLLSDAGASRERLRERARELRCEGTLSRFLDRCDPARGRLAIGRPGGMRGWWADLRVATERFPRRLERLRRHLQLLPELPSDLARALVVVLRVRRLRRSLPIPALLDALTPTAPAVPNHSPRQRERVVRGIYLLTGRWGLGREKDGALRSLAVYSALRELGWPAEFVRGRRKGEGGGERCWVEVDRRILWELRQPWVRTRYPEVYRFPPP